MTIRSTHQTSPLKIGIVSNPSHCKNHQRTLKSEGFDVQVLGASPREIPSSVDLLILRTESCSHAGSDVAREWGRKGGRLITESGMSGIRRELKKLILSPKPSPEVDYYRRALEVLRQERPDDTAEEIRETLSEMGAPRIIIDLLLPPPSEEVSEPVDNLFPEPYPEGAGWARAVPEKRLRNEAEEAKKVLHATSEAARQILRDSFLADTFPPKEVITSKKFGPARSLKGRPIRFFLFLLWVLPEGTYSRLGLEKAYKAFSGKRTDSRIIDAAGWVTSRKVALGVDLRRLALAPTSEPMESEPMESEPVESEPVESEPVESGVFDASLPSSSLSDEVKALRDDMESHILDLMTQINEAHIRIEALQADLVAMRSEKGKISPTRPSNDRDDEPNVLAAISHLRWQGARVSITFEPDS